MARAKTIKEVEVKFSPAFDKAINGVKTTKKPKAKTKKATKAKATKKTRKAKATTPVTNKPKRGYKITPVQRELTLNGVKDTYELYELTGKGLEQPKYFVSEEYAQKFVDNLKSESVIDTAFANAVKRASSKTERKDLQATKELNELTGDSKPVIEKGWATYFNGPSLDVEETVKNNEDIDA